MRYQVVCINQDGSRTVMLYNMTHTEIEQRYPFALTGEVMPSGMHFIVEPDAE